MASAYELMLVLRGRNYLSNDLRRAGADISRMRSMSQLGNARSQLQINAKRLASTKAIAQAELRSVETGARRLALNKAITAQSLLMEQSQTRIRRADEAIQGNERQRLTNAANLSRLNRNVTTGRPAKGFNMDETKKLFNAAQVEQKRLIAQQATLQRALEEARTAYANAAISAQQLTEREAALAQRSAVLTDKLNTTSAALELNKVKLDENAMAMQRLPLEKLGARAAYVEHLGRAFQTLGLISTAALGYAAHAASQFSTQLTLAATQATLVGNRTTARVQQTSAILQKAVLQQLAGGKTAASSNDLNTGAYTIFSGLTLEGNQKQQLREGVNILKEFSKVYTANYGQVEFNDVTKAGVALINNFGLSAKSIAPVMNQMQASVRFGAMTMNELTGSLNQVIPAFKGAGYGTKQMFADIAFVSRLFPSLRTGTTGLSRLTEVFGKYHDVISKDVGVNIAPGGHLSPVATIVQDIIKAHPALAKGGVDLQNYFKQVTGSTGTVQARRAFVGYATNLALYQKIARQVMGDNHELDKSFADMSQTPQVRWKEFTNQLHALVLEIGAGALPMFQALAPPIEHAVEWFNKLSPSTRKLIGEIAVITSVGALFGGTLLIVVGAVARAYSSVRLLLIGRGGLIELASESGAISARLATGLGLIGLIALMIKFHHQTSQVVNAIGGWKVAIQLLGAAMTALAFRRMIVGLGAVGATASTSAGEVGMLSRALSLLNGYVAVATIVIVYRRQIRDGVNKLGKEFEKLPGGGFDPTHLERKIPGLAWLQDKTQPLVNAATFGTSSQLQAAKDKLTSTPGTDRGVALIELRIAQLNAHRKRNQKEITSLQNLLKKIAQSFAPNEAPGIASDARGRPANANPLKVFGGPTPFSDTDVIKAVHNIVRLDELAKRKPTLANFEKAQAALTALTTKGTKEQVAAAQSLISALESVEDKAGRKRLSAAEKAHRKLLAAEKKAAAERLQALQDAESNIQSMYDSLLSQNQNIMGSLFSGPYINSARVQNRLQFGGKLTGTDYLKDLKSQTAQFKTFYAQIGRLQRRGAPQELIQQLIEAGPSALPAIKALSGMGKNQWGQYIKVFKDGQNLLHKQTMTQLTMQLKDYRKYGNKIALQIISGMRDKRIGLTGELKNLIEGMFGVKVPTTHGATKTNLVPHVTHHTSYHVTAPKSEHASIHTQLRHAAFVNKAKYERTR